MIPRNKPLKPLDYIYIKRSLDQSSFEKIAPIEFGKQEGITWTEDIVVDNDPNLAKQFTQHPYFDSWHPPYVVPYEDEEYKKILKQIKENRTNLALIHMGEVGWGVFARDYIHKGEAICMYEGVFSAVSQAKPWTEHANSYSVGTKAPTPPNKEFGKFSLEVSNENIGTICGERSRGFGAYLQHIPCDLSCYQNVNHIAIENVGIVSTFYYKHLYPFVYFKTLRPIKAGEMLGWDYGNDYWLESHRTPSLFTRDGKIASPESYSIVKFNIRVQLPENNIINRTYMDTTVNISHFEENKDLLLHKNLLI